jgi:hypothetical protein
MHIYSISDIKKELKDLSKEELLEHCMSLAKYKKDNKEFLNYLIFEAHDVETFVMSIKTEIDEHFSAISQPNLYLVKKSLRKILRIINRYIKYIGSKEKEAELVIYFLTKLKNSGIPYHKNKMIVNLYNVQIKRLHICISKLHEDLQYDLKREMEELK